MASIENEARAEAERRWPKRQPVHNTLRHTFVQGYIAGANRKQEAAREPIRVEVSARKGGKNSTLADMIVERANARGIRVEFVELGRGQEATREQVAEIVHEYAPGADGRADSEAVAEIVHEYAPGADGRADSEAVADALLTRFDIREKEQS